MLSHVSLDEFDKRIASLKSLIGKEHVAAARAFAITFEEPSDLEYWVRDRHFDIIELASEPPTSSIAPDDGETAMLLMHAVYFLNLGRTLRLIFQKHNRSLDSAADLVGEYSLVAFALRTKRTPFWPFEQTNLPLIDGYQNAAESWW